MGYDCKQFRLLIRRVCHGLRLWSPDVENLLLGTAAVESQFGFYMTQLDGGPGRGAFQVEPATEKDIWVNHLAFRPDRAYDLFLATGVEHPDSFQLEVNLAYGVAMARLKYRMIPAPLPRAEDVSAMAAYWDTYYNCNPENGTVQDFVDSYREYVRCS